MHSVTAMAGEENEQSRSRGGGLFLTTRWSVVRAAVTTGDSEANKALSWLCDRYWFPLFVYVRGRGHSPEDAEDLVQGFFEQILEENLVTRADAERGRFRSFLLSCLNHFLSHYFGS